MALRPSRSRLVRPIVLLPLFVVVLVTLSSSPVGSAFAPVRAGVAPAPAVVAPGTSSVAGDRLHAAQVSLDQHHGPAALPRPANGSSNWTLLSSGSSSNSSSNSSANASGVPPARQLDSMAYDPVDGYVVLFGGGNVNPGTQYNDTWVFSNGTWTQLNISHAPAVRRSSMMVWDAADGYILLFGGVNPDTFGGPNSEFRDTWSFLDGVWTDLTAPSVNATNTPSVRWNAQMAFDPGRGETILFGGCYNLACAASTNDTWGYLGGTWTNLTASVGAAPSVRGTATLVWYPADAALLMFGGANPNQTVLGDTWELGATGWAQLYPATSPSSRGNYWMIYDEGAGTVVLFGGSRYSVSPTMYTLSDTWTYSNATWTNQTLNNSVAPPALWGFQSAGAYNPLTGCGLLFGGADLNDANYAETWQYGCAPGTNISSTSGGPPPGISLVVTPTNGTAPLFFNATVQTSPLQSLPTDSVLVLAAVNSSSVAVWTHQSMNWSGSPINASGVLSAAGTYQFTATLSAVTPSGWVPLANASVSMVVLSGQGGFGPWLAFSVSPSAGPAPLNVTARLSAGGGTAPYDLSVCHEGPAGSAASGSGDPVCTAIAGLAPWDGAPESFPVGISASGSYTFEASVVDADRAGAFANVTVAVWPAPAVAPLVAHVVFLAPAVTTSAGASYGFVTSISGGVAPYDIQWVYGDGTMGSALPGATVVHSYTSSGSFVAIVTVTDGRGAVATASVGPLVVVLPAGPTTAAAPWASEAVLGVATVLGIVSIAAIAVTVQQLLRRREALNWARDLEQRLISEGSDASTR
jgi:hypothetical protein